jgi:hypothetical protein
MVAGVEQSLIECEIAKVISRLIAQGGKLWVEDERLRYSGPPGLLTDRDDAFIAEHKADALRVVTEWQDSLDGLDWPLVREGDYDMDGNGCGCIN